MARPSGTVTFLFTDIEGSTRLWDEHPRIMRAALERHDAILRDAINECDGLVFSTGGDGVAAAFGRADMAVRAAIAAQRALRSEPWPDGAELRVRMGMHTGEAHERDGDYFGPPVNLAARIMASASGGQVLVSEVTTSIVEPDAGLSWVELARSASKGNLPVASSTFVGRITDLQRRVADLRDHQLVTLTGPGGVGKTRLAIEVAALAAETAPDGTWIVELGPVTDPNAVVAAVAASLAVQPQPGLSLQDAHLDLLRRRRLLLVIDNCEHVLDATAAMVRAVTSRCPTTTVLATSREPLGVSGEQVRIVPSLESDGEASQLFIDRARAADGSFNPGDEDLGAIRAICQHLDGIPLAIELAAARCRSLSPTEILERLGDRFRLLRGTGRGGIERHQTLRAAVAWSYNLLSDSEHHLFDRLSAIAGTFELAATEAICADDLLDASCGSSLGGRHRRGRDRRVLRRSNRRAAQAHADGPKPSPPAMAVRPDTGSRSGDRWPAQQRARPGRPRARGTSRSRRRTARPCAAARCRARPARRPGAR